MERKESELLKAAISLARKKKHSRALLLQRGKEGEGVPLILETRDRTGIQIARQDTRDGAFARVSSLSLFSVHSDGCLFDKH